MSGSGGGCTIVGFSSRVTKVPESDPVVAVDGAATFVVSVVDNLIIMVTIIAVIIAVDIISTIDVINVLIGVVVTTVVFLIRVGVDVAIRIVLVVSYTDIVVVLTTIAIVTCDIHITDIINTTRSTFIIVIITIIFATVVAQWWWHIQACEMGHDLGRQVVEAGVGHHGLAGAVAEIHPRRDQNAAP